MSFEWNRIHKWEENIEAQVKDSVFEYVMEYYGVDEIQELTQQQLDEIMIFKEELNEYSVMQWGFNELISYWENEQGE